MGWNHGLPRACSHTHGVNGAGILAYMFTIKINYTCRKYRQTSPAMWAPDPVRNDDISHLWVRLLVGGWTTHLKNMLVKLDHFRKNRGEHKIFTNHQLGLNQPHLYLVFGAHFVSINKYTSHMGPMTYRKQATSVFLHYMLLVTVQPGEASFLPKILCCKEGLRGDRCV